MAAVERWGATPAAILRTHSHHDHVVNEDELRERYGVTVVAEPGEWEWGGLKVRGVATPGHSDDMVAFLVDDLVFTGDTLFKDAVGGGDLEQVRSSVMDVFMALPDETRVLPGHTDETTIGRERDREPVREGLERRGAGGRRAGEGRRPRRDARRLVARLRRQGQGVGPVRRRRGCDRRRLARRAMSSWVAAGERYDSMVYRRCGRSGLKLPAISLGLWHNFGFDRPLDTGRAIVRRAFDLGITHFDLANNYGPPYGAAEETFGRLLKSDLGVYRDELIVSTKAGWDMWPGPYGEFGSRKYLLASLDQSLQRLGLDYVDIFYSHRFDPETPLEETIGALDTAVQQGKALYAGISSYGADATAEAAAIARELHSPLVIHQPIYSIFNRWVEDEGVLDACERDGLGVIVFSPLAQGLLSDRYLHGIPDDSRAATSRYFSRDDVTEEKLAKVRALNEIAGRRGQSLAQMALAWTLRDERVTSALPGASSVEQLEANVAALERLDFSDEDLSEIDALSRG